LRYVIDYNLKNGLGNPSTTLYLQGCDKEVKCKGCHNWEMQEKNTEDYSIPKIIDEIILTLEQSKEFNKDMWLTILGGEPLAKYNLKITKEITKAIKSKFKDIKIVLYSWRYIEDIENEHLWDYMQYVDYGVLGDFQIDKLVKNKLPATTNQYIYDFNKRKKIKSVTI